MQRLLPILLFVLTVAPGCSTYAHRVGQVRTAFWAGDTDRARARIDELLPKNPREADVLKLERATILLCDGQPKEAEKLFREVRDNFDHLEQKDLAEGALSMLTDDRRIAYAGEDYEKVLIRVFLALSSLLSDGQDATAYALQVADKQQQIIQAGKGADDKNPKETYKQVAAGAYIHAALREETHQHYDDAARSLELVCNWAPNFQTGRQDLERLKQGRHSAKGNGALYVFTLVGRGPCKEERMEIPTTAALLVADRILSIAGKQSLPPTVAPIKVPCVVVPPNAIRSVHVYVDDEERGKTETLTNVGQMATEQADALRPQAIGRAVARRAVKKAAVYGAKVALDTDKGSGLSLLFDIAGVVWEATESADTRCWGLLPEQVQVLRIELPAGTHKLSLVPFDLKDPRIDPMMVKNLFLDTTHIRIEDGRNSYVLATFPSGQLVGKIVCSSNAK